MKGIQGSFCSNSGQQLLFIAVIVFAIAVLPGCVNYNLHYTDTAVDWPTNLPDSNLNIEHTLFLIGDAGGAAQAKPNADKAHYSNMPALVLLKQKLSKAGENSSVIFLGDNIYPNGMAPDGDSDEKIEKERALDEKALKAQLWALEDYKGKPFFLAGNHDWYKHGLEGVKRQKEFIEDQLDRDDVFLPDPGCGDPQEIEISENLTFILLDSQWWLEDWGNQPEINDGCDAKSREVFKLHIKEALRDHRDKNVVVALHHPLFTVGAHGGQYSVKQHIFPLTDKQKDLWIPLPILGSIYPFYRSTIGSKQDVAHPAYKALKTLLLETAKTNGHYIFASGHEHSLQYIEREGQSFIVSGAGSKRSPTNLGVGSKFAYGDYGFAQLDFYEDGTVWLKFWTAIGDGNDGMVVYRKKIKGPLEKIQKRERAKTQTYDFYESGQSTISKPLSERDFMKIKSGDWFWGGHYRKVYNAELDIPVLDLEKFAGGVVPVKMGGGFQTNSLRLEAPNGKQYTMRSVDKDPTRTVPYPFDQTFVVDILKDFFSAAHPLSALPIPALANAIGIYHTNPKLYWVPKQPRLLEFNEDYGDALYLVEERPDDDVWTDEPSFGRPEEIVSTAKMVEEVLEDHKKVIDQRIVLRARLFDMVLGDWDRHDDQWRWGEFEKDDFTYLRPIPRDRDQAFSNYDGLITSIARITIPFARQLRKYDGDLKNLQWSSYNARQFDHAYLTAMSWQDWQEEARYIQKLLTDEVIEKAFKDAWPEPVYNLDGPKVIDALKGRRDELISEMHKLYKVLAKKVDVKGTDKKDLFVVKRTTDSTIVAVYETNKDAEKERLIYERTFYKGETKEINLYGLDDDDQFEITGNSNIKIRLIGGLDEDVYKDFSTKKGLSADNIIYDTRKGDNIYELGANSRRKLSNDPSYLTYNRKSIDYEYDYGMILPSAGFNPDDGLLVGLSASRVNYGFKKDPYAGNHQLSGIYAFATSGYRIDYAGEFVDAIRKWNIEVDALLQSPLYTSNFYGLGNETENQESSRGINYNRVRQRTFEVSPRVQKRFRGGASFAIGPIFESSEIENTSGRFINEIAPTLDPQIFEGFQILGITSRFYYKNVDVASFPTRGILFNAELGWKKIVNLSNRDFAFFDADLSIYQKLIPGGKLALALRLGFQHRFNDNFPFYHGANLGGNGPNRNFRGFRRDRFTGQTAFVQNTDLRWKAFELFPNSFPLSVGFLGGFDYGRVWVEDEDSDTWHYSYGGGLWLSPFDIFTVNLDLFRGDGEFNRFTVGGQFFF